MGLVKVSTDAGICGYSDMETCASVAKACVDAPKWSQEEGMECFDGLATLLVGRESAGGRAALVSDVSRQHLLRPPRRRDPGDLRHRYRAVGHLRKGLRPADQHPARRKMARSVRAYASTLFRPTPEAMREAVKQYMGEGFTAVKFGWGVFGKDPNLDVKLVEAARDRLSAMGATCSWTPAGLSNVRRRRRFRWSVSIEQFRPFLVEELLHPEDYDGYRKVAESVDTPIACGEQEATEWGFAAADRARRRRCVAAGPDPLRRIYRGAKDRPHGGAGEPSGDSALLVKRPADRGVPASGRVSAPRRVCGIQHIARAAEPNAGERVLCGWRMDILPVPEGPGLGVEVNDAVIEQYRVA